MRKSKLTKKITGIILKEKRKNPLFGCRKLGGLLRDKYRLSISKSLINRVLVSKGVKERPGRKSETEALKIRTIDRCGLFLIKAVEAGLCFDRILAESIKPALPRLSSGEILYLTDFCIYAPLFKIDDYSRLRNYKKKGLWRMLGLNRPFSLKALRDFSEEFSGRNLHSFLMDNIAVNFRGVYRLRLDFRGGFSIYADPEFRSLWDNPQAIPLRFSQPLIKVKEKLSKIAKGEPLIIMGIPCSGRFPAFIPKFLKSANRGLKDIQIIGRDGQVLGRFSSPLGLKFILGFYPHQLSSSAASLRVSQLSKLRINIIDRDAYVGQSKTLSSQLYDNQDITLRNVLITKARRKPPCWGLITNIKNKSLKQLADLYCFHWPYLDEGFQRHIRIVEISSLRKFRPFLDEGLESLGQADSSGFFSAFFDFLKNYLYHKFFPQEIDKSGIDWQSVFNVEGRISKKSNRYFKVSFTGPLKPLSRKIVQKALLFINEGDVFWDDKKIVFFLK